MKESAIPQHAVDDPKPKTPKPVRLWLSDGSRVGRPLPSLARKSGWRPSSPDNPACFGTSRKVRMRSWDHDCIATAERIFFLQSEVNVTRWRSEEPAPGFEPGTY